jgi:signal transduction histidine kinase
VTDSPNRRLVTEADGERRRIERALHDGVQQDLIAVSVRLQLARQLAGADLPAAVALLDEIGSDVRGALQRVQALANGIYPPLLDARGLPDALRGAVAAGQVTATVETGGVVRYPAEIEAAVFFCCRAALDAAAADARVAIVVRDEKHALRLEISGVATGQLGPIRDRIEALGGELTVEPGTGFAVTVPY